jgi:CPA2 family monovalent cation:H+ antiporter-2
MLITGWASQKMGLTLAMGALIAGMIISDSEYNHQIIIDILPLRDYFSSIFFISVGMLLQVEIFYESVLVCLQLTVAAVLIKMFMAFSSCLLVRAPLRISLIVGLRLAQIGEFSLILAAIGLEKELFSNDQYQLLLVVSILSMLIAPLLIQVSSKFSIWIFSRWKADEGVKKEVQEESLSEHVIIAGYGLGGRTLTKVLQEAEISFIILELSGEKVKRALTEGMTTHYGDCTQEETLLRAGVKQARMIVYAINDQVCSERAIRLTRKLNSNIKIMVRTRLASQVEELKAAGADVVIPEEFETSIEIFCRVLKEYRIPNNVIEQQVELIRMEGYSMFRGLSLNTESLKKFSTYLTATLTESYIVLDNSWVREKTLGEIDISGATVIAVVRKNKPHPNPGLDYLVLPGDMLILFGSHMLLGKSIQYLREGPKSQL